MVRSGLNQEMERLQGELLKMGTLVEELIYKAIKSMVQKDYAAAQEVIDNDDIVDNLCLEIEQNCLLIIARQQPLAKDLRRINMALRFVIDLERIADHAVDLSEITLRLQDQDYMKPLIDIPRMGDTAREMLKKSLKAFTEEDTAVAWSLIEEERMMDALYDQIFRELLSFMVSDPRTINQATSLLLAAGHMERIGDHITNLGEMVIYMVDGERVDLNRLAHEK
ncbi:MAG: phosphate signaling complex protein PhoU [Chitinophagales bacterium]